MSLNKLFINTYYEGNSNTVELPYFLLRMGKIPTVKLSLSLEQQDWNIALENSVQNF